MRSYIFDMRVLRRAAYGDTRLISVAAGQLSLEHVAKRSRSAPYRCEFSSTPIIQGGRSRTFFLSLREQFGWLRCATAVRDGTRIRTIAVPNWVIIGVMLPLPTSWADENSDRGNGFVAGGVEFVDMM